MVEKQKGEYIGTRIPLELKDDIEERFVGPTKEYFNMSIFLRALIDEKMDPVKRVVKIKRDLEELKHHDPEYVRDLVK